MATVDVNYVPGAGLNVVNLTGTIQTDGQFDTQPVANDQIVYPDGLTVSAQLGISGPDGAYTLYHVQNNGTTVNEAYSLSTPDTTAPVLSSPTATKTGSSTATGQVTTDEANGTLFFLATANATETEATIEGSGQSQAVTATGVQSVSLSGLTPGASVYLHYFHKDAAGNGSNVVHSTQITLDAATESATVDVSLVPPTGYLSVTLAGTITPNGQFATQPVVGDQILYPDSIAVDAQLNISAADGSYVLHHVQADGTWVRTAYTASSTDSTAPVISSPEATVSSDTSLAVAVTTNEGNGTLFAVATANSSETSTFIINNGVSQGVSAIGQQSFSINGLQPGTPYYVHFVHRDAAGNVSNVVSSAQVVTTGAAPGIETATTSANWTPGPNYTVPTLESGFDRYAFEQWPTGEPQVGWQPVTWTADGSFDSLGNYTTNIEHVHDAWIVDNNGLITHFTIDTTGLVLVDAPSDTTPPSITLSGQNPMTLSAGSSYVEPGYSASDNVDGDLTGSVVVTGTINTNVPGNYTKTYTVTDAAGNTASVTRTITIVDTGAPTLTLAGANPLTITQGNEYAEPGYTATDAVEGDLTAQVQVTGSVDHLTPGSYNLNYVVQDSAGNQASAVRTVVVEAAAVDTIPGSFLFNSLNNQNLQTLVEFNPITITDVAPDTDIPIAVSGQGSPQYRVSTDGGASWGGWTSTSTNVRLGYLIQPRHTTSPYGNTSTTSVLNANGVTAPFVSLTKTGDIIKPVITLNGGDVTLVQGTPYSEPGFVATDNNDGDITGDVVVSGTVDHTTPNLYVITYTVQDAAGNTDTKTRLVRVEADTAPPVITLVGGNVAVALDSVWSDPGFSAIDNKDGDLTANVVVSGTVNTAIAGYYSLTYTVTDGDGNTGTATRIVRVGTGSTASGANKRSIAQPIATPI